MDHFVIVILGTLAPGQSHNRNRQKGMHMHMLKFVTVNPILTVLAAIAASFSVMISTVYVQVAPVAVRTFETFARPPPANSSLAQRGRSMTDYVIGIAVAALVVAIILPIAFGQFFAVDTSSWDAQTILIWGIIPLVVILGVVLFFLNKADDQA